MLKSAQDANGGADQQKEPTSAAPPARSVVRGSLKRGEIWLANLNPPHGASSYLTQPGKTRPVLIVQAQALLKAEHPSTYVIPLTTNLIDNAEPLRIRVAAADRLLRDSDLLVDQLRAIDNRRLKEGPLLRLPGEQMRRIRAALLELLGVLPS
jgi:mRNA interferase MazF